MKVNWTALEDAYLQENYTTKSHAEIGIVLNRPEKGVRNRCYRLGLRSKEPAWTVNDDDLLKKLYLPDEVINVQEIAKQMNRSVNAIHLRASRLGICNPNRDKVEVKKVRVKKFQTNEERSAAKSLQVKQWISENGHSKGMAGKKHTKKTKEAVGLKSKEWWADPANNEKIGELIFKSIETRMKNGTLHPERHKTTWKSGWREIGGVKKFYRSRWEANYAYFLQWQKENGNIKEWLHEPVVFWFQGIKRGCVSYLPDFWVRFNDDSEEYHEIKGWMDDRSKTKIRRMAKYHPNVKLIVIDGKGYAALEKSLASVVPGWEK